MPFCIYIGIAFKDVAVFTAVWEHTFRLEVVNLPQTGVGFPGKLRKWLQSDLNFRAHRRISVEKIDPCVKMCCAAY
jgi:hypothetical protein